MVQTPQKPQVLGAEPLNCSGILPQSSNGPVGDLTGTEQQKSHRRKKTPKSADRLQVSDDEGSLSV